MKIKFTQTFAVKLCLAIFCTVSLSGCGIYSFTGASIPPETKTFSVANFSNMAQEATAPRLTNILTEALKDIYLKQTRLTLVQSDGDFAFEGEIRSYVHGPVAITSNDQAAKERLTITIRVIFTNKLKESESFDKTFSQYDEYETAGSSFASQESALVEEIVKKLAEDIFNASAANW